MAFLSENMNIAISGTREALTPAWREFVAAVLHSIDIEEATFRVGDCRTGVDALVREYFETHRVRIFTAHWNTLGMAAGPERNGRMLVGAKTLYAFPSAQSVGTIDAINKAVRARIEVHVYPLV